MKARGNMAACILSAVGRVGHRATRTALVIDKTWSPALHLLEQFSHAIVIFSSGGFPSAAGEEGRLRRKARRLATAHHNNPLLAEIARILGVDEQNGIVEVDRVDASNDTPVWDIKPYFPVEDRVLTYAVPARIAEWPEWRAETSAAAAKQWKRTPSRTKQTAPGVSMQPIGEVRTEGGEFRLEMSGLDDLAWRSFAGFSHVRVFWWFDRFDKDHFRRATQCNPPYENAPRTGIFASRSPVRPNPVGLTTGRVITLDRKRRLLILEPLDALDHTPILDVQPYIPCRERVINPMVPSHVRHWPGWQDAGIGRNHKDRGGTLPHLIAGDATRFSAIFPDPTGRRRTSLFSGNNEPVVIDHNRITITGARQNNLRNVTCSIPRQSLTVVTGVSGSGKSSLAFDTLYAESQRRFMEGISTLGRQAFEQCERPEVESISNLPPAIAIEQKSIGRNPRSTVGTMTEIYDFLRLLFARLGVRHCPNCGRAIEPLSPSALMLRMAALPPGTGFSILPYESDGPTAAFRVPEQRSISYESELLGAIKEALASGNGALLLRLENGLDFLFHSRQSCYPCGRPFLALTSSTFSFNHTSGMCPDCQGLGVRLTVDPELIVTKPEKSLLDGASPWWGDLRKQMKKPTGNWMRMEVFALAADLKVDLENPWSELPGEFRHRALYGTGEMTVRYEFVMARGRTGTMERPAAGAVNNINRLFRDTSSEDTRQFYLQFMRALPCETCQGERLGAEGRLTTMAGRRYPEVARMSVSELCRWVEALPEHLTDDEEAVGRDIMHELRRRLRALGSVGIEYLTLDRPAPTLSLGEAQRIRLASQLGGGLTGLLYVLDEPSTGLHPRDHGLMLNALRRLRDAGNTVVVVEHDADTIRSADWILDLGPGAGEKGGRLVASGTPEEIMRNPDSLTGGYLSGGLRVADRASRQPPSGWLTLRGARLHTLKNLTVRFPLGVYTCVTGVSGSGKSSLVAQTLYPALARRLHRSGDEPGPHDALEGMEAVDKVISVTQVPIGRTPRSNPATYTGLFDEVRKLFAGTDEARTRVWNANRFSFNRESGRCGACLGDGRQRIEMHFMPDVWTTCPVCHGRRFNDETLSAKYRGCSIADVLEMDVATASEFFADAPAVAHRLKVLLEIGLEYLRLGQSALTLSGGEAQRVKLACELSRPETGRTVFVLDEPTSGLHFADIRNLIMVLKRIIAAGNTVIVVEHNPEMMLSADWIIDLGPEGGDYGGQLVAEGTPDDVARVEASHTGRLLRSLVQGPKG